MTTDDHTYIQSVVMFAERILADRFNTQVHLVSDEQILNSSPRSNVIRFRVAGAPAGVPKTVIIKQAVADNDDEVYDPRTTDFNWPAWRFLNEWAGLQFLNASFDDDPLAPRIFGGDRDLGVIVMEDLGASESLIPSLLGSDPMTAEINLIDYMQMLGRLHGRTAGKQDEYNCIRQALGPDRVYFSSAAESFFPPDQLATVLESTVDMLGITPHRRVDRDLDAVAGFWNHDGPFLAYTHGDPAPGNEFKVGHYRRLVDFEFGGFHHALTEGVYARMQFVTGWCVNRIPDAVAMRMEDAYRTELAKGCPEADDDLLFYRAMTEACAYANISMWHWAFPDILSEDEEWGLSTHRQRLLRRLKILAETTTQFRHLEALGEVAYMIEKKLYSAWSSEGLDSMPYYPAFR